MTKSLYYIECTCIKDCNFPNTSFKVGDVVYVNPNASSNEMYVWNKNIHPESMIAISVQKYSRICGDYFYMPFTRKKEYAKKWQIQKYPERIAESINSYGEFNCVVKEIKITYEEGEV